MDDYKKNLLHRTHLHFSITNTDTLRMRHTLSMRFVFSTLSTFLTYLSKRNCPNNQIKKSNKRKTLYSFSYLTFKPTFSNLIVLISSLLLPLVTEYEESRDVIAYMVRESQL